MKIGSIQEKLTLRAGGEATFESQLLFPELGKFRSAGLETIPAPFPSYASPALLPGL